MINKYSNGQFYGDDFRPIGGKRYEPLYYTSKRGDWVYGGTKVTKNDPTVAGGKRNAYKIERGIDKDALIAQRGLSELAGRTTGKGVYANDVHKSNFSMRRKSYAMRSYNKAFDDFTEAEIEQFEKYLDKIQNNLKSILEKE